MASKGKNVPSDDELLHAADVFTEFLPDEIGVKYGQEVALWFELQLANPNPDSFEDLMRAFLSPCFGYASAAKVRALETNRLKKKGFDSSTSE